MFQARGSQFVDLLGEFLYGPVDPIAEKQQQGERGKGQKGQLQQHGVDNDLGLGGIVIQ